MPDDTVHYDPADPEDLPGAWQVYLASSEPSARDATRRPDAGDPDRPPLLYSHLLATCEGAFWVARIAGRIVGFAAALPRGRLWFLSELWVAPAFRDRGIGTRLLRYVKRSTRGMRGRVRAALAGDDAASLALALRDGMQARYPVFRLQAEAEEADRLWRASPRPARARLVRYAAAAGAGPRSPLARLDASTRGQQHAVDHAFWLALPGSTAYLVWMGKRAVAYFYVHASGEIGPLCAAGPAGLDLALRHASRIAAREAGEVRLRVPAVSPGALAPLLNAGFRLTGGTLLLSTGEIPGLERYLPGDDSIF